MAQLAEVTNYLTSLNQCVQKINQSDDYDRVTKPTALKMIQLASPQVNYGRAAEYIVAINNTLNQIYQADNHNDPITAEKMIKTYFVEFNTEVQDFRAYLATHWWQFGGGTDSRPAVTTVPIVDSLLPSNE